MPRYCYACPKCGQQIELFATMETRDKKHPECPDCYTPMDRNFQAESVRVGNKDYCKPIHSDSLAIMASQREEHQKQFPDVSLDSENRPIFTNYKTHQKYLDTCGFIKQRQKIKRRGKKLA